MYVPQIVITEVFHARYPDGAHDAETLLVSPDGGFFIVTKGETNQIALYRFPRELRADATHQLERVGGPGASGKTPRGERITDARSLPMERGSSSEHCKALPSIALPTFSPASGPRPFVSI
jgi:hypothetical protein